MNPQPQPCPRRTHLSGLPAALLVLATVGCGGGSERGNAPGARGSGKVVIDGSSTVFRISRAAQLGYSKVNPDVAVNVGNHGTGGGFSRYLQGEIDIIDASRDAKPEERSEAESKGLAWTRLLVGYDGITVVVNPRNQAVKSLTVAQLKALYAPDSDVRTWSQLDPSWPAEKIVLYAPDTDSGTFEYFHGAVLGKDAPRSHRKDVQPSPDDNVLVRGVEGDANGIGYFGYAYYAANKGKLRAVPIRNGPDARPVEPTMETILAGDYAPLSRPLYIFVKNDALKRPEVAAFVKYYLENVAPLAAKAGYVPPTDDDRRANATALERAIGSPSPPDAPKAEAAG